MSVLSRGHSLGRARVSFSLDLLFSRAAPIWAARAVNRLIGVGTLAPAVKYSPAQVAGRSDPAIWPGERLYRLLLSRPLTRRVSHVRWESHFWGLRLSGVSPRSRIERAALHLVCRWVVGRG